jgi:hypothetical protein
MDRHSSLPLHSIANGRDKSRFELKSLKRRWNTTWLNLKAHTRQGKFGPMLSLVILLLLCFYLLFVTLRGVFLSRKEPWRGVDWDKMTYTGQDVTDTPKGRVQSNKTKFLPNIISKQDLLIPETDWEHLKTDWDHKDFTNLGLRLRTFLPRFDLLEILIGYSMSSEFQGWGPLQESVDKFRHWTSTMEARLFPWTRTYYGSLLEMKREWKVGHRGIVMTAGTGHERSATFVVKSIRSLGCKLPIEIWYIGEKDLNREAHTRLKALDDLHSGLGGVQIRDVTKVFNQTDIMLEGWDVKPFAILASSFREVLFMDADVVWLDNPEHVFDDAVYRATRTLFYYDRRTLFNGDDEHKDFVDSFIPHPPSKSIQKNGIWNKVTLHEQESGVVVIDKYIHFHGLLGTCKMNEKKARDDVTYKIFHGDKETFWAGFEMAGDVGYGFSPHFAGTLGKLLPGHIDPVIALRNGSMLPKPGGKNEKNVKRVCALQLAHPSSDGKKIAWFNGGILRNKFAEGPWGRSDQGPIAAMDGWVLEPAKWELFEDNVVCIYLEDIKQMHPFRNEEKLLLERLGRIWDSTSVASEKALDDGMTEQPAERDEKPREKSQPEEKLADTEDGEKQSVDEDDPFQDQEKSSLEKANVEKSNVDDEDWEEDAEAKLQREKNSKWLSKLRTKPL